MSIKISCVVEGKGEEQALPELIRRVARQIDPSLFVEVPKPVIMKRNQLKVLEARVRLALNKLQGPGGVFILLDADEDCPALLGPELFNRARPICGGMPVGVALAKREFESWFLAAAESIGGCRGLSTPLQSPPDPENIADAKGWLREQMPPNRKYSETSDQAALTAIFDLNLARSRSDSFDKCYREIERLLRYLNEAIPTPRDAAPEA